MISFRTCCCLALLLTGTACKTQRTVLAGPTQTGLEAQGQSDVNSKYGNQDPSGYQQNASEGLNAMSEKMFGGKLKAHTDKEFNANKNYLTREFGSKKDFNTKTWKGAPESGSRTWTDKLFDTDDTSDTANTFAEAGREVATKESRESGQTARTKDFAGAGEMARTNNYRPAEKALEGGRDNPKLSDARPDKMSGREKAIHDRIANSNASASEINKFLGKP